MKAFWYNFLNFILFILHSLVTKRVIKINFKFRNVYWRGKRRGLEEKGDRRGKWRRREVIGEGWGEKKREEIEKKNWLEKGGVGSGRGRFPIPPPIRETILWKRAKHAHICAVLKVVYRNVLHQAISLQRPTILRLALNMYTYPWKFSLEYTTEWKVWQEIWHFRCQCIMFCWIIGWNFGFSLRESSVLRSLVALEPSQQNTDCTGTWQ